VDKLCQLLSSCPLERTSLGKLRPRLSGTEADLLVRQLGGDEVKFPGGSVLEAELEKNLGFKKTSQVYFFFFLIFKYSTLSVYLTIFFCK
jgi:hypothetical protein